MKTMYKLLVLCTIFVFAGISAIEQELSRPVIVTGDEDICSFDINELQNARGKSKEEQQLLFKKLQKHFL